MRFPHGFFSALNQSRLPHEFNVGLVKKMAGALGFEPRLADPESAVLPLYDAPSAFGIIYGKKLRVKRRERPAAAEPC